MIGVTAPPFRFNATQHQYVSLVTGQILPHITGMLTQAGLVDDTWFTEESSIRGQIVHKLTADFDLGAIEDVSSVVSKEVGYLHAHAKAMAIFRPEVLAVEEPLVDKEGKWGGRPDRELKVDRALAVLEVKSTAAPHRSHEIQTALQAILVGQKHGLPPAMLKRFALYLKPDGKFKLLEHTRTDDFTEARRVIRMCAA